MNTTTLRLEDELKARITAAAERAGKTPHAFMLDAIADTVEQDELDAAFHEVADQRWSELLQTGLSVPWEDAKAWIEARARGEHPPRPTPRRFSD